MLDLNSAFAIHRYLITNQCTDCAPHELELALPGSIDVAAAGKWAISWSFVDCVPEETSASRKLLAPVSRARLSSADPELDSSASSESLPSAEWLASALLDATLGSKLSSQQVSTHRRLTRAAEQDSDALPSAEWLESMMGSANSDKQQTSRPQIVSRRQLLSAGGHRRHLSLRALMSAKNSEQPSRTQHEDKLPAGWHQESELAFWYPLHSGSNAVSSIADEPSQS